MMTLSTFLKVILGGLVLAIIILSLRAAVHVLNSIGPLAP